MELPDQSDRPRRQRSDLGGRGARGVEGDPTDSRVCRQFPFGRVADASLGDVEDSAQADVVIGIRHRTQKGERVADLAPLVEAHGPTTR